MIAAALLAASSLASSAAAQPVGWADWLMPTGQICVQTGGSAVAAQAAQAWNRTDADMIAKVSCVGYPRSMTVVFVGYSNPNERTCAVTYSEAGWTRKTVRGVSALTPNAPAIRINYATSLRVGCRSTPAQVLHVYAHELGHVLGLAHNKDASVMGAWQYRLPTAIDTARVNRRY